MTEAELHGADRVARGFSVNDKVSEFRALHLWSEADRPAPAGR